MSHISGTTSRRLTPLVSVIMVNYNGRRHLDSCLRSLFDQSYRNIEIIVVDNGSTDDSVEYIRTNYPRVCVVEAGENIGFGAGNNLGLRYSKGEYVIFTNYDARFEVDWVDKLVTAVREDDGIAFATPKILLWDRPEVVNTCGLALQYTGIAFSRGIYRPSTDFQHPKALASVTGCAFIARRDVLDKLGAFDEEFQNFGDQFYSSLEDADLSWRALLAGYQIILEPRAKMYHKYRQKLMTPIRYYYLECGRYYLLLKNYAASTLLLLTPVLLLSEVMSWGFAFLKGRHFLSRKLRSYGWLCRRWSHIIEARRQVQRLRSVDDVRILKLLDACTEIKHSPFPRSLTQVLENTVNLGFQVYYHLVVLLLTLLQRARLVKVGGA